MLQFKPRLRLHSTVLLSALALSACGGGGSDAGSAPTAAATTPASATPVASSPAAPVTSGGTASANSTTAEAPSATTTSSGVDVTCGLSSFQATIVAELNRHRAAGATCGSDVYPAASPVSWNSRLTDAAHDHSLDMASQNYFSHTSLSGASLSQRVDARGYAWSTVGENIAAGYTSLSAVIQGWMNSPGHCRNIMNAAFTEIGMACSKSSTSTYGSYYTLDLGRPR